MTNKTSFVDMARERVIVFDGGMGTQIQERDPSVDDFGSAALEGCNELLSITRPQWIREIHAAYFDAGADVVETNTFGANEIVLAEFDIPSRSYEINLASARLAREVAASYRDPRFVVGSVGPGTKLVTLGHVGYDAMLQSYRGQMRGLLEGGVDGILIETAQDIQQVKISLRAAREIMQELRIQVPVMVQVTVELTGTMLVGTDIQAALSVVEMFPVASLGLNCATGPDEMRPHLDYLRQSSPFLITCLPNAGLPENIGGRTVYPLTPEIFATKVAAITREYGVNIVGGCCGTTPAHIRQLVAALGDRVLTLRQGHYDNAVSSLYNAVPLELEPKPLYVGERTNANGSKLFRDLLAKNDYDGLIQIAKGQVKEGAHVLDCCTAYVGRDEVRDMSEFLTRVGTQVNIPVMIDSTETNVIEASLKILPGKAIVNSINLEDGEKKAREILDLCRTYGAAVVALTIDEEGMAKSCERKLAVAQRLYHLAHNEYGLKPEDIIFDPLTFTLGSGDQEFRRSAVDTLDAIRAIKQAMPGVKTILGLSNVSFGLDPLPRKYLNSVMLYHAVQYGLDLAIANAGKIVPLHRMGDDREVFEDLIFDRRKDGYDPLKEILARFSNRKKADSDAVVGGKSALPIPERLAHHIVDGEKLEIIPTLNEALKQYPPLDIINNFLLAGMKVVGDKFGAGEMQLPFVLESAEAMKAAVAHLEPYMEKSDASAKGKIVLATVKGDVHDIGKNLVDIILTNNGFQVVNMGIKQPIEQILEVASREKPDAIGLSGLLVKSTVIMKSDLEEMHRRSLQTPVILGGAALTRRYVEEDCQATYGGKVFYAEDAFAGLRIMNRLMGQETAADIDRANNGEDRRVDDTPKNDTKPRVRSVKRGDFDIPLTAAGQSSWVKRIEDQTPTPPFWGTQVVEHHLSDVFAFLDEMALVRSRWQFIQGDVSEEEYQKIIVDKVRPLLNTWKARAEREQLLKPRSVYGYFACEAEGNRLHIYERPEAHAPLLTFEWPRQSTGRRLCLTDFFHPIGSGRRDVIAMQLVTMGHEASTFSQKLYEQNAYSDYFYFHGLSTELAEAYAEFMHARIRRELGIHHKDAPSKRKLFAQGYQGSRYSFGYPACPDLDDNKKLVDCLHGDRIGVDVTEAGQMVPEQTTCAIVAWHPQARYFSV